MKMLRHDRFERSTLDRPVLVDGGLQVEGIAARVHRPGDPLMYTTGPEHRRLDELQRIIEQLPNVPITMPHGGRVVGRVTRAWLDGGERAAVRMLITDRAAIEAIQRRTDRELSIGYGAHLVDGYQTGITLFELSIVEAARCGATCSINTDSKEHSMDPELLAAASSLNLHADGRDERGLALAVLRACGLDLNSATSNGEPISKREDAYVIARAKFATMGRERANADAAIAQSFATVKPTASVQRTDCGCGGKPSPHADADLEREARERNARSSRLAWAQGTEHADEAEAIDAIKTRTARPFVPSSPRRGDSAPVDELAARQAMLASSRAAYLEPSADPLASDKE